MAPWESLMAGGQIDAVVVASAGDDAAEELRTEQLRKLVQEGVPLLVAHPVLNSMLACYEIDMIRRESGCIVLPYLPARSCPSTQRLGALLRDPERSPIGRIEQVVFERTAKDRSRRAVLSHFARDVDLIRAIAGDVLRSRRARFVERGSGVCQSDGSDVGRRTGGDSLVDRPKRQSFRRQCRRLAEDHRNERPVGIGAAGRGCFGSDRRRGVGGGRRRMGTRGHSRHWTNWRKRSNIARPGPTGSKRSATSSWPKRFLAASSAAARSKCSTNSRPKRERSRV